MSYAIPAELLAAQQKTSYEPSLLLTIADNGLPHPRLLFDLTGQGNEPTAACAIPGVVIIRARHHTGVGVELQRITDPTQQSQWESWGGAIAGAGYPALLTTMEGDIVLTWQELGTTAVKWQRSSDAGLTWTTPQTLWTPGYTLDHLQVGVSSTRDFFAGGALFYAHGTTVAWRYFDSGGAGSWADEYTHDFGAAVRGLGALFTGGDYVFAAALADFDPHATRSLVVGSVPWDETDVTVSRYFDLHGSTTATYDLRWPALARLGEGLAAKFWLAFALGANPAAGAYFPTTQVVASGLRYGSRSFTSPLWLHQDQADRLTWLEWTAGVVYGAAYGVVYQSVPVATVTADTRQIIRYTIEGGVDSTLRITLDNRHGDFTGLETGRLGAALTLARGALVNGVARRAAREPFTVAAFEWSADQTRLTITAFNALGLLSRWRAEFAYTRLGLSLYTLLRDIVALAGVGAVITHSQDSALLNTVVPEFVIQAGQSALEALQVLQNQYQFRCRPCYGLYAGWAMQGLEILTLPPNPAPTYTFGRSAGQHPTFFVEDKNSRRLPDHTHVLVLAHGVGGEAIDVDLQAETGRQLTRFIRRKFITSAEAAEAVAAASLAGAQQAMTPARLVCLPAFQVQVFDGVATAGGAGRYVAGVREIYDTQKYQYAKFRMPFYQELDLGGPGSPVDSSGDGLSVSTPAASSGAREIRRATLVSFNPATWRALVQVENSPAASEYPAGQWLPASLLTAGAAVGVVLFDESNPNDGLIVGPYGAAAPVLGAASADAAGLVELATAAEVAEGTEAAKAVTPATLKGREPFYLDWANTTNKPYADELPRKVLTGTIAATGWYTFAATPLNPGPYLATLKISVGGDPTIRHELRVRVVGHGPAAPNIDVESSILTAAATTSGLRYIRVAYPQTAANGYGAFLELYTYNATPRDFTIELIDAVNVSLGDTLTGSAYSAAGHHLVQSSSLYYTGTMPGKLVYASLKGNASSATWAGSLYTTAYEAGEALATNDIIFLDRDNTWYQATVAGRVIPPGTAIARCAGAYAAAATVGAYPYGRFTLPSGVTGVVGEDLFLRGSLVGGVFTTDGTVTSVLTEGYSYLRFGRCHSTSATVEYDGNHRLYSLDDNGHLERLEGLLLAADTLGGLRAVEFVQVGRDIIVPAGRFARTPTLQVTAAAAPGASVSGNAILFLDSADGDLKVRFPNGVVRVIAVD